MEPAKNFILQYVEGEIRKAFENGVSENYKSILQQYVQRELGVPPTYHLLSESGPDHDKEFEVAARVDGEQFDSAWGKNKKEAEQRAAFHALKALGQID